MQDTDFSDLVHEADVALRHSRSTSGLAFQVSRPGTGTGTGTEGFHGYYADLTVKGLVLGKATGDERTPLATARLTRAVGQTHRVRIETVGTSLKVHVDDMAVPKISTTDSAFATGANGWPPDSEGSRSACGEIDALIDGDGDVEAGAGRASALSGAISDLHLPPPEPAPHHVDQPPQPPG
ncbi:hypothetical protein [Streptomyces sindenensis]|uniref:Laminin G domain-containing protein n=1 Tax=Streptomyces sindenensis TaxID=67363 RepID=A0ABW6ENK3_9ACTN